MERIDLHGLNYNDAESMLIRKIEELWTPFNSPWSMIRYMVSEELVIITGNSEQMKEMVRKILTEYDLEIIENNPNNTGYIKTVI